MDDRDDYIEQKVLIDMIDKHFQKLWDGYKEYGKEYDTDHLISILESMEYTDKGIGLFNICGCGIPDKVTRLYHEALKAINDGNTNFTDNELLQAVVLYTLNNFGMTEHGGSIYSSWLTEKGETALKILDYGEEKTGEAE